MKKYKIVRVRPILKIITKNSDVIQNLNYNTPVFRERCIKFNYECINFLYSYILEPSSHEQENFYLRQKKLNPKKTHQTYTK